MTIPDEIIADAKGMTYRSFTATSRASHAFLKERPVPDRLADLGLPVLVIFGSQDRRWKIRTQPQHSYAASPSTARHTDPA